jgi:hypothetical protein
MFRREYLNPGIGSSSRHFQLANRLKSDRNLGKPFFYGSERQIQSDSISALPGHESKRLSVTFSEIGKSVIMKFFDLDENFR